jgi:hypothetical protein
MEELHNITIEKMISFFGFEKVSKKSDWSLFKKENSKGLLYLANNGETKKFFLQSTLKSYDKFELFQHLTFDVEVDIHALSEMDNMEIISLSQPLGAHMEEAICLSITAAANSRKIWEAYFDKEEVDKLLKDFEGLFFDLNGKAAFPFSFNGEINNYLLLSDLDKAYLNDNYKGVWHTKYYQGSTSCYLSFDPVSLFSTVSDFIPMDYFGVLVHPSYEQQTMEKLLGSLKGFDLLPFNLLENKALCSDNFRFLVAMANNLNVKKCHLDCSLENAVWTLRILPEQKLDVKTLNFANGLKAKLSDKCESNIDTMTMRDRKLIVLTFQHRHNCLDIAMEEIITYFGLESYIKRFLV